MRQKILFVEAPITGATDSYIEAFQSMGLDAVLLAQNPQRYLNVVDQNGRQTFSAFQEIIGINTEDDEAMLAFAEGRRGQFHGLLCVSDFCLIQAARLAEALALPFINAKAVEALLNKEQAAALMHDCGITTPRVLFTSPVPIDPAALPSDLSYPIIVKPTRGSGSMGVRLARSREELLEFARMAEPIARLNACQLLAQEFVPGPLLSLECWVDAHGEMRVLGYTSRELGPQPSFPEVSAAFPAPVKASAAQDLERWVRRLVEKLEIRSAVLHIEYVHAARGPVIVEVNARPPGSLVTRMISASYGASFHALILKLALGMDTSWPKDPSLAAAVQLVYAQQQGWMKAQESTLARLYPGVQDIVWHLPPGGRVDSIGDFRSCVATVLAIGHNALDALMRASVAASALNFHVE